MADDTRPAKPRADFPLFPHRAGYWCKKVNGKAVYFTRWRDDPHGIEAERIWATQEERIRAGLPPRFDDQGADDALKRVFNQFLHARKDEINERNWCDYRSVALKALKAIGEDARVSMLEPVDFRRLRKALGRGVGPTTLGGRVQRVRTMLRWAHRNGVLGAEPKYGSEFDKPSAADVRRAKAKRTDNVFTRDEIRAMLNRADPIRRAWVLLGINAALGNRDISDLRWAHLEQRPGWLIFPREKTGIDRVAPVWEETAEALAKIPRNGSDRVFLSRRGRPLIFEGATKKAVARRDGVGDMFGKLLDEAGISRDGRGFYGLRSSFATIASGVGDAVAVKTVMGHARESDITQRYVRLTGGTKDDRLVRVVEAVRAWLFGGAQ